MIVGTLDSEVVLGCSVGSSETEDSCLTVLLAVALEVPPEVPVLEDCFV